ncbi:MAG: hypothetical protein Q8922_11115 [Bacteroidota bacterium]|nr:hypothetical protein [Bacteroidota bacterium]MDP4233662.1 hypothetical protein [Bacteroidota bacterium]MDP4243078.1 hypothetical protein [Bacteroidota bacterium]MDP4288476.1 hypothetical protein [Bacteroidota bacterium]
MKSSKSLALCILQAFFIVAALNGRAAAQQNDTITLSCHGFGSHFMSAMYRGWTTDTLILLDSFTRRDSVAVSSPNDSSFYIQNGKLPVDSTRPFPFLVIFQPTKLKSDTITVTFSRDSCTFSLTIYATALGPAPDYSTFYLTNAPQVIAMQYTSDSAFLHARIQNAQASTVQIESIKFQYGEAFHLDTTFNQWPIALPPGQSFDIPISFQSTFIGFRSDVLIVSMPNHPILPEVAIAVQGVRLTPSSVISQSSTTNFWLYPNPAYGAITIHSDGVINLHVKVTDILGRTLREANFVQDWTWDGASASGQQNAPGTYYFDVSGISDDGQPVHEVRRVALLR